MLKSYEEKAVEIETFKKKRRGRRKSVFIVPKDDQPEKQSKKIKKVEKQKEPKIVKIKVKKGKKQVKPILK